MQGHKLHLKQDVSYVQPFHGSVLSTLNSKMLFMRNFAFVWQKDQDASVACWDAG